MNMPNDPFHIYIYTRGGWVVGPEMAHEQSKYEVYIDPPVNDVWYLFLLL